MCYLTGDDVRQVAVVHCRSCLSVVMTSCKSVSTFRATYNDEEPSVDIWHSQTTAMISVPSVSSALAGHTWAPSEILSRPRTHLRSPRCFRWPSNTDSTLPAVWLRSTPGLLEERLIVSTWNRNRTRNCCDLQRRSSSVFMAH